MTGAVTSVSAPGAPWRRLAGKRLRPGTQPTHNANRWAGVRAVARLLTLLPVLSRGLLRMAWLQLRPLEATTRATRQREQLRALAANLLRALHVQVQVVGPRTEGAVLYACNHLSWLDVLVLLVALPDSALIAKREVATWPLIGSVARTTDTVFVERSPTRSLPRAIARVAASLRGGRSVALFAEGTTTDGSHLLPFKSPFFEAALNADVPVVPVSLRASTGKGGPSVARHVCWWGDGSLLAHLPLVAGTRRIRFVVRLGEAQQLCTAPALAPTRFDAALPDAERALRRTRSELRRVLARRAHHAVARQAGCAGTGANTAW